jgi:hypothetical protein
MQEERHGDELSRAWIQSVSREKPDSDRWIVEINVVYPEADGDKNQRFEGPLDGFPSKAEAESWELEVGRKWIDDGKPVLHKS